jgi:hypothetical protein
MDADTFFTNPNWVAETSARLDTFKVVQPFAWLIRMPPDLFWLNPADIDVATNWEAGGLVPFRQVIRLSRATHFLATLFLVPFRGTRAAPTGDQNNKIPSRATDQPPPL